MPTYSTMDNAEVGAMKENAQEPLLTHGRSSIPSSLSYTANDLPSRPFRHGLFSCFEDMEICCEGFWCTPCLYGNNVRMMQELEGDADASCLKPCCGLYSAQLASYMCVFGAVVGLGACADGGAQGAAACYNPGQQLGSIAMCGATSVIAGETRSRFREKYNITKVDDSALCTGDGTVHFFCHSCALCQEKRELKAIVQERSQGLNMMETDAHATPPPPQYMV